MELLKKFSESILEAGTDEAGRGCLAGPVTAAAVILPPDFYHPKLTDSKKLSEKLRYELRPIIESNAIAYSVVHVPINIIDDINILHASIYGMHQALKQLKIQPEYIIVDGNRFKQFENIPHSCIIKGDSKYLNIAAASILAKTYRDDYMNELNTQHPGYNWDKNKGYPTNDHRNAILKLGVTEMHRKSFKLLPEQLKLEL